MGLNIDGRKLVINYRNEIMEFVKERVKNNLRIPGIAVIQVGKDGGSTYYHNSVKKICEKLNVHVYSFNLKEDITEKELIEVVENVNSDDKVDGILALMPIPKHIDSKVIISKISYKKDIDGLTDINCGRFYNGKKSFVPCTPKAIMECIKSTNCNIEGKKAVVIGRSNVVGRPVAQLLLNANATVTICHSRTQNLKDICKEADILVSAIGKPNFVNEEYVKKEAIVIDVGTSMVNGKMTGDVDYERVAPVASFITPVPGGVGSLTTTMLIKNACEALKENVY